jgi:CHAD domain-containing protein
VVHDFRKITRELQAIVEVCGIRSSSRKAKMLRRRLQRFRHSIGEWRDSDVMLKELKAVRRKSRTKAERRCWSLVVERTEKHRRRAIRKFLRQERSLRVKETGVKARALVKKTIRSEPIRDSLRLFLQQVWDKWRAAINGLGGNGTATQLHAVRIKSKALRYAIELYQRFFPDHELEKGSLWLKNIQNRVGAWHDELTLGQRALEAFSRPHSARDRSAISIIRQTKEREIALAEAARRFILSIRNTAEHKHLRRRLSASVFAISDGRDPAGADSLSGPLQ